MWRGGGAGLAGANFRSAEAEGVAGETRRRMFEARSAEFASPPPRRPPPRAARSDSEGPRVQAAPAVSAPPPHRSRASHTFITVTARVFR